MNKTHLDIFVNTDEGLLEGVEAGGVEHLLLDASGVRAPGTEVKSSN